jgi:hypothetical protein
MEVTFTDPPGPNYYLFDLGSSTSMDPDSATYGSLYVRSAQIEYNKQEMKNGQLIDDKLFDGQPVTLKFVAFTTAFWSNNNGNIYTSSSPYLKFKVRNLPKERYDYELYKVRKFTFNPEAEPTLTVTNIENGVGIFIGSSVSSRSFEINPF